jgi:hypothetical protein
MKKIEVKIIWEDGVWQSEIENAEFGCVLESGSVDALIERVKTAVQEIYEIDYQYTGEIEFVFHAERTDNTKARVTA